MKTYFCDVCKKEAEVHIDVGIEERVLIGESSEHYDFCFSCYKELKKKVGEIRNEKAT